jgi:hypothetical protein
VKEPAASTASPFLLLLAQLQTHQLQGRIRAFRMVLTQVKYREGRLILQVKTGLFSGLGLRVGRRRLNAAREHQ